MDIAQFRLDFPEFANDTVYTDPMVTFWSTIAEELNSESVFGNIYNLVIELYTAHCISIQAYDIQTATNGGIPTGTPGVISEKTVGSVSISYDTTSALNPSGDWLNLTIYGRQYLQLSKMYGKGGIQICGSCVTGTYL